MFDVLYGSTPDQKKSLPSKYRKATKNSRQAQAFIRKSTQEEKQELLTLLGIEWLIVLFDRGFPQKRHLKEIFEKYKDPGNNRQAAIADAVKDRVYVLSDAEFFHNMGLMAQVLNTNSYKHDLLLSRAGFHIQRWGKAFKDVETKITEDYSASANYMVKYALNTILAYEMSSSMFGVINTDTKILLYLYSFRSTYIGFDKMLERFGGNLSTFKVRSAVRRLLESQMIQKKLKEQSYTIAALGLRKVAEVYKHILKSNELIQ